MKEILILIATLIPVLYLAYRLVRRGVSKKYERHPKTPWSSLNEGIDPSQ
jgi:hypothetical protein